MSRKNRGLQCRWNCIGKTKSPLTANLANGMAACACTIDRSKRLLDIRSLGVQGAQATVSGTSQGILVSKEMPLMVW